MSSNVHVEAIAIHLHYERHMDGEDHYIYLRMSDGSYAYVDDAAGCVKPADPGEKLAGNEKTLLDLTWIPAVGYRWESASKIADGTDRIEISSDDGPIETIDRVNEALAMHGLCFEIVENDYGERGDACPFMLKSRATAARPKLAVLVADFEQELHRAEEGAQHARSVGNLDHETEANAESRVWTAAIVKLRNVLAGRAPDTKPKPVEIELVASPPPDAPRGPVDLDAAAAAIQAIIDSPTAAMVDRAESWCQEHGVDVSKAADLAEVFQCWAAEYHRRGARDEAVATALRAAAWAKANPTDAPFPDSCFLFVDGDRRRFLVRQPDGHAPRAQYPSRHHVVGEPGLGASPQAGRVARQGKEPPRRGDRREDPVAPPHRRPMSDIDPKIIEACAEAAHQANRIYCAALGDTSQPAWKDAPDWQRQSAIEGVKTALAGATPEEMHIAWGRSKADDGWVWGPIKDPMRKQHPCLVPYAYLPPEQRAKAALFIHSVRNMAAALGAKHMLPADRIGAEPRLRALDLGGGVQAVAEPIETDTGPAFKITATKPLLESEACRECGHIDPASRVNSALYRCTACGYERRWIGP